MITLRRERNANAFNNQQLCCNLPKSNKRPETFGKIQTCSGAGTQQDGNVTKAQVFFPKIKVEAHMLTTA